MLNIYTIRNDKIIGLDIDGAKRENALVWIRCILPTQDEVDAITSVTKIPKEEIEEFLSEDERPRIDVERTFQIIYESPHKNETINSTPVSIFLDRNYIATVEKKEVHALDYIGARAKESTIKFLFRRNPAGFMHYVLDMINDDFLNHINHISRNIKVFKETTAYDLGQKAEMIYSTSVILSVFHQALIANLEAVTLLRKANFRQFTKHNRGQFSELYYDVRQLLDTERVERETVSNLFNLQSIISSNRLNLFIKKLTSLALIVMIPTLIASAFGMNVKIPFAESPYGFYYILGIMFGLSLLLLLIFKLLDWL